MLAVAMSCDESMRDDVLKVSIFFDGEFTRPSCLD